MRCKERGMTFSEIAGIIISLIFIFALPANLKAETPIRVMPLGDSITRGAAGSPEDTGYRRALYLSLTTAGHSIDFVGNLSDGVPQDFDRDHEGHDGWRADQIRENVYYWLVNNPADIVLLHIGTNDISHGETAAGIAVEIDQILDKIDQYETDYSTMITVFLARIINRSNPTSAQGLETTALNDAIQSLADTRVSSGDNIIVVDQENALVYPDDLDDTLHPNDTGYSKMAAAWFTALDNFLPPQLVNLELLASSPNVLNSDYLFCTFELTGSATTAAIAWIRNAAPEMALYLPFEGGAENAVLDLSGNAHSGIKASGAAWNALAGYDGNGAFVFDGSSEADIDMGDIMPLGSYTKTAWVKRTGPGNCNIISGNHDHAFWAPGDGFLLAAGHNPGWFKHVEDSEALQLNTWYFVAVSFDPAFNSGQMILYKNGVEIDRATGVPTQSASDRKVWIGAFESNNNWNGVIDDARIYERALSADQILTLFHNGIDTIMSPETAEGEQWQAVVTPISQSEIGASHSSNTLTIYTEPSQATVSNLLLSATSPNVLTTDDLICTYDLDGTSVTAATAWLKNGATQMGLYLPMEGGTQDALADYSGNAISVIAHGDPAWAASEGCDGFGAFIFDGNDDLSAGENFPINSSYTKAAWVYRTGDGNNSGNNIISGDENSGGHALWAPKSYDRKLSAGHNGNWNAVQDAQSLALNTWYFVAVTYNADTDDMILYKNGAEVDRATVTVDVTDRTISIGSFGINNGYMWKGAIDDVRIYPYPLAPAQILSLYSSGGNRIVFNETDIGDEWQAQVTPFSAAEAGLTYASNTLTIQAGVMPPAIISTPVTEAVVGQLYSYAVTASGNPSPAFTLTVHPAGMTIDPVNGLIEWVPAIAGDIDITIEASNSQGSDTQAFTIHVVEPACPSAMSHYWKLDDTGSPFEDFYGSNDAICTNCPSPVAGIVSGAQHFDGAADEVNVADDGTYDWGSNQSFSVEYWMKTSESTQGNRVIIGRDDATTNLHWWIGCKDDGTVLFQLRDKSGAGDAIGGGSALNDGAWHLVVAVRDGNLDKNRIYVDGVKIDSLLYDYSQDFSANVSLNIGYLNLGGHYRYHGILDEIALYDRALSDQEIMTHYYAGGMGKGYCEKIAPQIVSSPVEDGFAGDLYTYDVSAIGFPAPTYALLTYPAGMTINAGTGLIEWTPSTGGDVDVTVEASNSLGSDTQNFTISVGEPLPCPEGITHYWMLEETAGPPYEDFVGTLDASTSKPPTSIAGIVNNAQQFGGTGNEINVPPHPSLNWDKAASFSIEFWMKKETGCTGSTNEVIIGRDGGGSNLHWWIGVWCSGSPQGVALFQLKDENRNGDYIAGTTVLTDGVWHHIVAVRDEDQDKNLIYVDGIEENSMIHDYTGNFSSPNAALEIGHLHAGYYYNGALDEIAVYERALLPVEIQQHYQNGLDGIGYCPMQHSISGNVTYYFNSTAIQNADMQLSGDASVVKQTDAAGYYQFTNLQGNSSYTITPSKTDDISASSILMYDASLTAQIAVALIPDPPEHQRIAADVDQSGVILMYDASMIAMHAVGLAPNPESKVGNWLFEPESRSYSALFAEQIAQDYTAILLGDVDGNWTPFSAMAKSIGTNNAYSDLTDLWGMPGEKLIIPIRAGSNETIYACDITFSYQPSILNFVELRTTALSTHFQTAVNFQQPGNLRLGCYGVQPITEPGTYLELVFDIAGQMGDVGDLTLESYRINADQARSASAVFTVGKPDIEIPADFALHQNYPNPFNPETIIEYELANREPAQVRIRIYNIKGELVKTLADKLQSGGKYQLTWDGTDDRSVSVPTGVYFYEINAATFHSVRKMIKVK
ncbi:putative Ig domain-containing protein [candidate division KSB1 bacterium]|nr:putative Ig domain-containing protein [candidate division KSB1 bacterium]